LQLRKDDFHTDMAWAFKILEVPTGTLELARVQQAYRRRMREFHPDRNGDANEEEEQSMKAAMNASIVWQML
jgi:DnaJ-class molecular chaperone